MNPINCPAFFLLCAYSALSLILFGEKWMPLTSRQIMRSVNQELCFTCTMYSMKTLEHTSVKPSTLKGRTGTRLGSMWSVSELCLSKLDCRLLQTKEILLLTESLPAV